MANDQFTTHAPVSQSAYAAVVSSADDLAKVIAQRLAIQSQTNPQAAADDYHQHVGALSPAAKALFDSYIAAFAVNLPKHFVIGDKVTVTDIEGTGIVKAVHNKLLWVEFPGQKELEPVLYLNAKAA